MSMFITHRDVAERLRNVETAPWVEVESNPYEVRIHVSEEKQSLARDALTKLLGGTWDPDAPAIKLQSVVNADRWLPVHFALPAEPRTIVTRPLWKGVGEIAPEPFQSNCKVASYHSYKGGVGRTTTLLATLGSLLRRNPPARILLVDADIEAPGLTWMLQPSQEEHLSLLDFLALVHDSDDWRTDAIPLAAGLLRTSPKTVDLPDVGRREIFFLPAIRRTADLFNPPVTPEQVVRGRGRAFVVGDALQALGQALNADFVLVDARAGISEFASPLFLDPRIESIVVMSCDGQSVEGTLVALDAARSRGVTRTCVVISIVPPGDSGRRVLANTSERVIETLVSDLGPMDDPLSQGEKNIELLSADFAEELVGGSSLEDLLSIRIPGTKLGKDVGPALAARLAPNPATRVIPTASFSLHDFIKLADRMEYAERNAELGLLSIPALRALVEIAPNYMPNRVVLGAKGAGKTFAWGQMVLAGDWRSFYNRVRGQEPVPTVPIIPFLQSEDLDEVWLEKVRVKERALGIQGISPTEALARLGQSSEKGDPVAVWVNIIRARLQLPEEPAATIANLVEQIRARFGKIILVTDGLEGFFQVEPDSPMSEDKRGLLRALLQEIPNRLREQPECPLGLVTFVRRDLAAAVITQNFGQFESKHQETALRWSPTEAIRLVCWLLQLARWPAIREISIDDASIEQLITVLHGFWNEKMGGSKDASTWRWVLAALSDFKAVVQARDLVRFLRAAAQQHGKRDLPLAPAALRSALPEVSDKKVEELETEIPGLRTVFKKLREVPSEQRVVPFVPSNLGITPAEVEFLERLGLLIRPDRPADDAYLQEVVRHGLGYGLGRRGRARIVSLYTQALRRAGR